MANDHEQLMIDLLTPVVAVPVSTGRGDELPYLRLRRVGGAATSRVREDVIMVFEWYDHTEMEAQRQLEQVRGYLMERAASVALSKVIRSVSELGGPVRLPDPDAPGAERYTMTLSLGMRRRLTAS